MAENLTQVNSYQDKLLEAMSIVSSQLISSIPYDKTVTCTIVSDEHKTEGKYKVTNGDATFDAYSSDTKLKVDDVVYVTIPEGDYDNQKIIQGKKTSKEEKPFVFTTPFDTILDLTDNLIANEANEGHVSETKSSLIANNGYITEKIKETVDGQEIEKEVIKTEKAQFKPICHLKNLNLTGYSRLGLKADFMSWIPNAVKGSYGLRVTVIDNLNTTTTDDKQVTSVQQTKTMLLDVSDMYGSPYNFESYYSQEKVFPITELNTITDIIIEFYQIAGSFYDVDNNILTLQDATINETAENQWTYSTEYGENLFVDSVYVSVGYDVSEITDEYIVPVINDSMTYSEYRDTELNKKEIDLRWVHQFDEGPKVVEPESDFQGDNPRLKDCEIRWYRYRLGAAAADEYCGVYWTGLTITKNEDKYLLSDWDGKLKTITVTESDGEVVTKKVPDYGETQALENIIFSPDTSYQTEQIKAIIYLNGVAIRGPVITFRNEQPKTGEDVSNFLNALEIECVDNTLGNYLIYNEAGNILNTADGQLERKLQCNFAETGSIAKSALELFYEKGDTITWKIPIKNSMIGIQRCGKSNTDKYEIIALTAETYVSNTYFIKGADNKYTLSIGDFKDTETYYKHSLVSENIQLNKVWIQLKEYDGNFEDLSSVEHFKEDGTHAYYAYEKDGVEYYKNINCNSYEVYYEPWNIYKDANQNYLILQGERTLYYNEDTKITSILYPTYKISAMYSMYNMNNTIACTIRKDRMIYTTEKEFTFGVSGTMGSDKSLVVDFVGGQTAIIADDTTTAYQLEVRMYDENNKPEDISTVPVAWSWYAPGEDIVSSELKFKTNNTAVVELDNSGLDIDNDKHIYIAKVVVGEEGAELETYFPIPIKASEEYSHIEGATSVIYLSNGEPDYYKGDYKLYETVDDTIGSPIVEITNKTVTWEVISQENDKHKDKDNNEYRRFVADINKTSVGGVTTYKGLKPISVYTEGIKNYAVVAKIDGIAVWQQPILVIRNQYPSRVINKWDGKTLTTDKETGTILSTAIAAGRKDNNTFTGVMIGDWTGSVSDKSLTQATGVFGFHQGAMCYAFMDNGTAFLGKSGEGRIDFNGNNGKIYSQTGAGMEIDLDDGLITSERLELKAGFVDQNSTEYLILNTNSETSLMLPTVPTQHGIYPFELGKYLKADFKGQLYAASGKIGAWNFLPTDSKVQNTTASAGSLYSGAIPNQWSSIILDPVKNEVVGGKFKASILEALQGTIKLGGFIKVYDATILKDGEVDYTSDGTGGGTLGFMAANFGGSETGNEYEGADGNTDGKKKAGIGMNYSGGGTVKATSENAGMSYSNFYISLQSGKGVFRGSTARLILQETATDTEGAHAGLGYGGQYLSCNTSDTLLVANNTVEVKGSTVWSNGNLTVGKSEVDGNGVSKVKTTHLSGALTVGTAAMNATSTLNGKLTINTGGAAITGNAQIDYLGLGIGANTSYRLYVSGTSYLNGELTIASGGISSNGGYTLNGGGSINGELTLGNKTTISGQLIANGGVDFSGSTSQKGIKAQFA